MKTYDIQGNLFNTLAEAVARGVLLKKVFLEISQNSQENTCARVSFLIKLQVFFNKATGLQLPVGNYWQYQHKLQKRSAGGVL